MIKQHELFNNMYIKIYYTDTIKYIHPPIFTSKMCS